jgi:hypothetical protein
MDDEGHEERKQPESIGRLVEYGEVAVDSSSVHSKQRQTRQRRIEP